MSENKTDKNSEYVVFYITAQGMVEANQIAMALVNERLAACVNIIPQVHSFFWWEGKIDNAYESMLIGKTDTDKIGAIKKRVKEIHSYDVPEIIFLPITAGYEPYLNWIKRSIS